MLNYGMIEHSLTACYRSKIFVEEIRCWYAQATSLPSNGGPNMKFTILPRRFARVVSMLLLLGFSVAPVSAQQPASSPPARTTPATADAPAFDDLLSTDTYKLYGEVRNVGQLLSNGGAGEIVDPIVKLADPGPQFKSIISFLKKNSEVLAQARLMFATWPVRSDVPAEFVAIEFPTKEDAAKFAPKLEIFLPTVLPPVPVTPESKLDPKASETAKPVKDPKVDLNEKPAGQPSTSVRVQSPPSARPSPISLPVEERLPFVITHAGNLVCISDKSFKFSGLRPKESRALFQDQNFRAARDQFSSEPIFFFFNVALEDKTKPSASPTPFITADETAQRKTNADLSPDETPAEAARSRASVGEPSPDPNRINEQQTAVLVGPPASSPSPTATPTREDEVRRIASNQVGQLLDSIGYGEPQWPDAVGVAVELSGNEYIVRAVMIDKSDAKKTPVPFFPQLIGGPAFTSEAASVLPDDTDVLISASVDLTQTFEGMRKETEKRHKADTSPRSSTYENGVLVAEGRPRNESLDAFAAFEKNAGIKIKDDLLPPFGHEIAIAGSLKTLNAAGMNLGLSGAPVPKSEAGTDKDAEAQKKQPTLPALLIEVRDRDAARAVMPKVLSGLGVGEANLIAQTEKNGDTEVVNYGGIFAYAFVGDFVVISDANGVHKIVDSYVNHQTLSSNTVFRNARRWQSARTTGQIYVSPSLMQGFQDEVRKKAATMDAELRDFLLGLNPNAEAITYALSDDGMGMRHELRLPKNYILMTIASISSATKNPPAEMNEGVAMGMLTNLVGIEVQYKAGPGKGSFATMKQLVDLKMFPQELVDRYGYDFDVTVSGDQFAAVATPKEYGKTGKRSFFVDQTGVVRGDDHAGGPASVADKPVQQE
jgi:hypothetical protein